MSEVVSSRRQHTRDRLLSAASEVFGERGVAAASVEEICERAGFTRGAFYSNFDSKDDLCLAVLRRRGDALAEAARRAIAVVPDAPVAAASIDVVIAEAVEVFRATHPLDTEWILVRNEFRLYALRNPAIRASFRASEAEINAVVGDAMEAVLRAQQVRPLVPMPHLLLLLDAYCERSSANAVLEGHEPLDDDWADGLTLLLRSLLQLPQS